MTGGCVQPEFLYVVCCRIDRSDKAREWLAWLRNGHIADVIKGGALSAEIFKLDDEGSGLETYEIHYRFASRAAFDDYKVLHAARLQAEGLALFPPAEGFVYSRRTAVKQPQ